MDSLNEIDSNQNLTKLKIKTTITLVIVHSMLNDKKQYALICFAGHPMSDDTLGHFKIPSAGPKFFTTNIKI